MAPKREPRANPRKPEPEPDFETALDRLQAIVAEMESGDLSLETMMVRFEEGRKLAAACNRRLQAAEQKIEQLLRQDGRLVTEPFEPGDGEGAPARDR